MAVVLGYDESPGAEEALRVAIDVANASASPCAWSTAPPRPAGWARSSRPTATRWPSWDGTRPPTRSSTPRTRGWTPTVELVSAKPAEALVRVAEECDAMVIVVGTSGESPIKSAMLGSTPHKLLQLSTRPVLCVPPGS